MEITREQFIEEVTELVENGAAFNVNSVDSGGVYLSLYGCILSIEENHSEIAIYKPNTLMEVDISFEIIDSITKEESTYTIEFNNGLSDVEIEVIA